MATLKRKKKRKKIKFRKLQFKMSKIQYDKLDDYCYYHRISLNKLLRRSLKEYMDNHNDVPAKTLVHKNQMSIFDLDGVVDKDTN